LVESISQRQARTVVVTIGGAGTRIGAELHKVNPDIQQIHATNLRSAVELARSALGGGGTVLFSPAAPSFDEFKNWSERSGVFTSTATALIEAE